MKNYLLLLLLIALPLLTGAQIVTVSEDIPMRNDVAYEVIGKMKGRLLFFRDQTSDFEVQAFNEKMREVWSKELDLDKRNPKTLGLTNSKEDFTIFYRFRRKSQTVIKAQKYDPAANLIDSTTVKDYGYLFFTPDFEIIRSEDKSKVLVYYIEKQSIIHAISFDVDSMRVLWDRQFSPEDFDYSRDILHTVLDNMGNVYFVLEKNNLRYKKETHYYEVHQFIDDGEEYKRYNIPLEGKLTYDVMFSFDNLNKRLKAGGLYAEKNPGRANGYFFLSIPRRTPKNYAIYYDPFEDEFISTLMGKEVEDNKGIMECSIQDLILRQDGGLLIIGERNRQYERRMAGTNRIVYDSYNRYIVDYFFDDLFLISIHPDGTPHWKQVLHKKQYSQDDEGVYSSYFMFITPKRLRFLFNDEISQENTVSEYVINGHGEFDRNSILSTENLKLRLRFRDATQVGAREVIIPSERRNQLRLVKVEY
jgi:hypothetical protein